MLFHMGKRSMCLCVLLPPQRKMELFGLIPRRPPALMLLPSYDFHSSIAPVTPRTVRKKTDSLIEDYSGHTECQEAEDFFLGFTHQRHRCRDLYSNITLQNPPVLLSILHKGWAASSITPVQFTFGTALSTEIFHSHPHPCISHNGYICNYCNPRDFRTACSSTETFLAACCSPTIFSLKHLNMIFRPSAFF